MMLGFLFLSLYFGLLPLGFAEDALVTLVTGTKSGYEYGAVALGESLDLVGSKLARIAMVTPEEAEESRQLMSQHWKIIEVEPIYCLQKAHPSVKIANQQAEGMVNDLNRFESTCTKFHAWALTQYNRILFMDSDMVVLQNIDHVLYKYSNASFVAAPEVFPPDTFNSGLMIFKPNAAMYDHLVRSNNELGSAEGGDQGIFNMWLCPKWFTAHSDDAECGKIPWFYNVEVQHYQNYQNYLLMHGRESMKAIHYINDGKPWKTLYFDLNRGPQSLLPLMQQLSSEIYAEAHMHWRYLYMRAVGIEPPAQSIFYNSWSEVKQKSGRFKKMKLTLFDDTATETKRRAKSSGQTESVDEVMQKLQKSKSKKKASTHLNDL